MYKSLAKLDDSLSEPDDSLPGLDAELIETWLPAVLDCIINANSSIPDWTNSKWASARVVQRRSLRVRWPQLWHLCDFQRATIGTTARAFAGANEPPIIECGVRPGLGKSCLLAGTRGSGDKRKRWREGAAKKQVRAFVKPHFLVSKNDGFPTLSITIAITCSTMLRFSPHGFVPQPSDHIISGSLLLLDHKSGFGCNFPGLLFHRCLEIAADYGCSSTHSFTPVSCYIGRRDFGRHLANKEAAVQHRLVEILAKDGGIVFSMSTDLYFLNKSSC